MKEIWGPAWFATALCVIVMVSMIASSFQSAAPAFFSFLPVVFLQMARTNANLARRIEALESGETSPNS